MAATSLATKTTNTRSPQPQRRLRDRYRPGPSLKEVNSSGATIVRGHSGEDVRAIQQALNDAGARPPLKIDGLFGPKTEAALERFQGRNGVTADPSGVVGRTTLGLLTPDLTARDSYSTGGRRPAGRAPQHDAGRPQGSVRASDLARTEDAARRRTQGAGSVNQVAPVQGGTADARLAAIQGRAVNAAQTELNNGVREHGGRNRGTRVDQYARDARMRVGGEWCGYFTQFSYSQAARETGAPRYRGTLHSFQKARSQFTYRDYTNNSRSRRESLDGLRQQHEAQGSTRRFMVLEGSSGQRWAQRHNRSHETFSPSNLPIRPGDTILYNYGHVGMVESYNPRTGDITTVEGNVGNRVQRKTFNLNDARAAGRIEGFGRPALGDFE